MSETNRKKDLPRDFISASTTSKTSRGSKISAFQSYETYFSLKRSTPIIGNTDTKLPPKKRKISIDFSHTYTGPSSSSSIGTCSGDGIVDATIASGSISISISSSTSRSSSPPKGSTDFSFSTTTPTIPMHDKKVSNTSTHIEPLTSLQTEPDTMRRIVSSDSQEEAEEGIVKRKSSKSKMKVKTKPKYQKLKNAKISSKQNKYVPDQPMSTEEMKAWRREARRVRNRQSAAASRQKVRDRIIALEAEAAEWRSRYEDIMAKIATVEQRVGGTDSVTSAPTSSLTCDTEIPSSTSTSETLPAPHE